MRPWLMIPPLLLLTACGHVANINQKARTAARERQLKKFNTAATSEVDRRIGEKAAGEIVFVDGGGGFVLVRARAGLTLAPEQELECRGKGTGRIRITPERKNVFVAADIVNGTPAVGDSVIPVKGTRPAHRLVPVVAQPAHGVAAPANTVYLNPGDIRPEDLPRTTLDDPGGRELMHAPAHRDDGGGNILVEPPLPQKGPPLLPEPELPQ